LGRRVTVSLPSVRRLDDNVLWSAYRSSLFLPKGSTHELLLEHGGRADPPRYPWIGRPGSPTEGATASEAANPDLCECRVRPPRTECAGFLASQVRKTGTAIGFHPRRRVRGRQQKCAAATPERLPQRGHFGDSHQLSIFDASHRTGSFPRWSQGGPVPPVQGQGLEYRSESPRC